jgi:RNA recognition motif-containing protein
MPNTPPIQPTAGPSTLSSLPISTYTGPSSSSSSSQGKPDRLYVGNLSPVVDEYTLIQIFSKHGKITKLDFMFHKSGALKGKPRGYAFIELSNKDVSPPSLISPTYLDMSCLYGRMLSKLW